MRAQIRSRGVQCPICGTDNWSTVNRFDRKGVSRWQGWRCRQCHRNAMAERLRERSPERWLVDRTRVLAQRQQVPFDLTEHDICIPDQCPVLGIFLSPSSRQGPHAPALIRIDPQRGYEPGNVDVVSRRASRLLRQTSGEEVEAVLNYLRRSVSHGNPDRTQFEQPARY